MLFVAGSNSTNYSNLYFDATADRIEFYNLIASANSGYYLTTGKSFRDPSAWYHIVLSVDTTVSAGNRVKLYINGSQVSLTINTELGSSADTWMNSATQHYIGKDASGASQYYDGYITEINFIDGQALTPSSFGETDSITGRWKAKAFSGTYGTNGFYLKFADNSGTTATTLGKDSSPNSNNWTPNNFSVTAGAGNDSLVDSPSNYGTDTLVGGEVRGNYCTLSPIDKGSEATLVNGNLDITWSGVNGHSSRSSYAISSGKWYWEVTAGANASIGIIQSNIYPSLNQWVGNSAYGATGSYAYAPDGRKVNNSSYATYGSAFSNGNVIGVAYDATNGRIFFSLNGTWQASSDPVAGTNSAYSGISGEYSPAIGYWTAPSANLNSLNFGQRAFVYTAPTGFKALCTTNLPTPTIKKPSSYFDALAYTGTGASNSISSLGFSPDLVWIKNRGTTTSHALYDTTRGTGAQLSSNLTDAEVTSSTGLTAFGSNGFTIGTSTLVNTSGTQYVAWAWDEAPMAGMDIVSFTGTGATQNVSHNLGVAPKMVIYKCRNTAVTSWVVGHSSVNSGSSPWNYYLVLNATDAQAASSAAWNNTAPTSTQFTVGGSFTPNTFTYIAYCFAEVEGFSKFGSYTGNASADGPFVYCGFRPKLIIGKRTDAVENWIIYDTSRDSFNVASAQLQPNTSIAETTANSLIDFNSNGFKFRSTNSFNGNSAGGTHIFMAFAESPFKYARAR